MCNEYDWYFDESDEVVNLIFKGYDYMQDFFKAEGDLQKSQKIKELFDDCKEYLKSGKSIFVYKSEGNQLVLKNQIEEYPIAGWTIEKFRENFLEKAEIIKNIKRL